MTTAPTTPPTPSLRAATDGDVAAMMAVMGGYRNAFFPGDLMRHHVFVAEQGGEVVGFVGWRGARVLALYVVERLRGKRMVGDQLLAAAEAGIRGAGHTTIRVMIDADATGAHRFYCRQGYDTHWDRDDEDIAWMTKQVA